MDNIYTIIYYHYLKLQDVRFSQWCCWAFNFLGGDALSLGEWFLIFWRHYIFSVLQTTHQMTQQHIPIWISMHNSEASCCYHVCNYIVISCYMARQYGNFVQSSHRIFNKEVCTNHSAYAISSLTAWKWPVFVYSERYK